MTFMDNTKVIRVFDITAATAAVLCLLTDGETFRLTGNWLSLQLTTENNYLKHYFGWIKCNCCGRGFTVLTIGATVTTHLLPWEYIVNYDARVDVYEK